MRRQRTLRVLGIETSCDETAAAVVIVRRESSGVSRQQSDTCSSFAFDVRSSVVASQVAIHARTGGIVPEVAAREHVTKIIPVIERALRAGGMLTPHASRLTPSIDAIAVTAGPGLITSLSVGAETARSLAYAWRKPLVGINHIEGHVLSALLPSHLPAARKRNSKSQIPNPKQIQNSNDQNQKLVFPALALIVSGGHTELLLMRKWAQYECIGATRDDAAGEAFDKVARILGLPYPGGPAVAKTAEKGNPDAFNLPRGMLHSGDFDFSFSGLKTAVRYLVQNNESRIKNKEFIHDVCASFQQAAVDVLVAKTIAAAQRCRAKTVLLGGGVAANTELRHHLADAVHERLPDSRFLIPDSVYTGDNAAMIAAAGGVRLLLGERTSWQRLDVDANWELGR